MVVAVPVFRDGVVTTAADLAALNANIVNLYAVAMGSPYAPKKPMAVLRVTSTTRAVPAATDTAVVWDVADINTNGMWSSGNAVTIQTAGTYRLSAVLATNGVFNDGLYVYIAVNGTSASTNSVGVFRDSKSFRGRCSATVSLAVGAKVYVLVNSPTTARTLAPAVGGCRLEVCYVGPP